MCGLSGAWERGALGSDELRRIARDMASTLTHRGPDSSGEWVDAEAGFAVGHRRLAIVDLSPTGRQPMVSSSGRLVLAYNGEIYNFRALGAELERAGHEFRGHCDAEVLVEACDAWGVDRAVERCVGMFAFALWDRNARSLTLVRDRMGIKPLYWAGRNGRLLFASQPRAFTAHPRWRSEIDREAFALYLRYGYVPAPFCIYQDAFQVRPGRAMTWYADGTLQERCYWDLGEVAASGRGQRAARWDEAESIDTLDSLLRDAVQTRMIADVPLGAFLSGGVDSSSVVALMQAQSPQPVKTFSIGFREDRFDEARQARAVAEHLGTDHTELYVEPRQALDLIPDLAEHYDEPFADTSQLPTLLVSRLAREQVTVALSGDGGDELFAGYNRHLMARRLRRTFALAPLSLRRGASAVLRSLSPRAWDALAVLLPASRRPRLAGDKLHKLAGILSLPDYEQIYAELVSHWPRASGSDPTVRTGLPSSRRCGAAAADEVEVMQLLDMLTYLPGDILNKVDRASMAYSLEVRVPLLDHRVVEHSWSLPVSLKIHRGRSKWLLRRVLDRYVPRTLTERPKMGFDVPMDGWLRGPLREWSEELLGREALAEDDLFDVDLVRSRWREHLSGVRNWQHSLWIVLMAQMWRRRWLGPQPLPDGARPQRAVSQGAW